MMELAAMPTAWVGERLKSIRERLGMTQGQLATAAGAAQNSISQWERGVRTPDAPMLFALADALGVEPDALRQPVGDPVPWLDGREPDAGE